MNMNLQNLNLQSEEKRYFKEYRDKVIELWRELLEKWEITQEQLNNSYFELYIKK